MKYLVTGGCGFLGSNLAAQVLKQGDELVVFGSLYRFGASQNLDWLRSQGGGSKFISSETVLIFF